MRKAKILAVMLAAILVMPLTAAAQRGEKTFGVKTGYVTRNKSALAGIYFQYRFSSHFCLSPNIDYVFRNEGSDAFLFNIDCHFPWRLGAAGRVDLYPLVGVNYVSWNFHDADDQAGNPDVTTRRSRFGLDAGAGIDIHVSSTLKLTAKAKFNAVSRLSTGLFSVGIGYCF